MYLFRSYNSHEKPKPCLTLEQFCWAKLSHSLVLHGSLKFYNSLQYSFYWGPFTANFTVAWIWENFESSKWGPCISQRKRGKSQDSWLIFRFITLDIYTYLLFLFEIHSNLRHSNEISPALHPIRNSLYSLLWVCWVNLEICWKTIKCWKAWQATCG